MAVVVVRALWGERKHGENWDDWNVWQIISVTNSACVSSIHSSLPVMSPLFVPLCSTLKFWSWKVLPAVFHQVSKCGVIDEKLPAGTGRHCPFHLLLSYCLLLLSEFVSFSVVRHFPAAQRWILNYSLMQVFDTHINKEWKLRSETESALIWELRENSGHFRKSFADRDVHFFFFFWAVRFRKHNCH